MKIVLACNTMGRGGAELQVRDYALRLVKRGHDVMVVSMLPFEDFEDELRAGGVETVTLGMTKGKASARGFVEFVQLLRRFRPDVVHAHMFAAILATRAARAALTPFRLMGGPKPVVIGTAHTPFEFQPKRYLAYRLSAPFSDLWTCVCREGVETHERHRAVPRGTGVLTANGIDVVRFRPDASRRTAKRAELGVEEDTFLWLAVGSFRDEQKDYDNLLRAFARLRRGPPTRLAIAGDGKLLAAKKGFAKELALDNVDFLGLRGDIADLMQAADAFVMGSAWEAMPIVLLEAGASALPSVVTDVGQNKDIVAEGTGFVVAPKDHEALAAAMRRMLELPKSDLRTLGERARLHVSHHYNLDVIVEAWEGRYRDLVFARS